MIKRVDMAVYEVVKAAVEGTLRAAPGPLALPTEVWYPSSRTRGIIPQEVFDRWKRLAEDHLGRLA